MTKLDQRAIANVEVALENICRKLPHGGDHETRKLIAKRLLQTARKGNTTLGGLEVAARRALDDMPRNQVA